MKCPKCGSECGAGARFCRKCGAALVETGSGTANATPTPPPAKEPEAPQAAAPSAAKSALPKQNPAIDLLSRLSKKQRRIIAVGAVCAVIAIIVIAIFTVAIGSSEQASVARKAIETSEEASEGFVSGDYTDYTPYSLTDFKHQEDVELSQSEIHMLEQSYGAEDVAGYKCTGIIANESFSTSFTATVYMCHDNGHWEALGVPNFTRYTTVPLKGVSTMNASYGEVIYDEMSVHTENVESTLDEDSYTSTATGNVVINYWYGTETIKTTQTFTFNSDSGWTLETSKRALYPEMSWNLKGKTFSVDSGNDEVTSSITFEKIADNEVTASYKLKYKPSSEWSAYKKFSVSGTLKGTLYHEANARTFSVLLVDTKDKDISFECDSDCAMKNGTFTAYNLDTHVETDKGTGGIFGHGYRAGLTYSMSAADSSGDAGSDA